mgnify:CR=1 FL=1
MTFHAQIASPLGPILLCSEGQLLSGLYFTGQADCPVVDGVPAHPPSAGGPSAGMMDGLAIRKFKAYKNTAGNLFGLESGYPAGKALIDTATDESGGWQLLQTGTPAATVALFKHTQAELHEYFTGRRKTFSVPLEVSGTVFQKKVWDALLTIPYGQTVAYGDVARTAGLSAQHGRPVGTAVGRNPITIIIPCHRVLSGTGTLTGYTGGLERKYALLELEGFTLR